MQSYYRRDAAVNRSAIFFCSVSNFFSLPHSSMNDPRTDTQMSSAHTRVCASLICLSVRESFVNQCGSHPSISATLIFQTPRKRSESQKVRLSEGQILCRARI